MKVRIYAYGTVRQAIANDVLDLVLPDQSHFHDLIEQMVAEFGPAFAEVTLAEHEDRGIIKIKSPVRVLLNGMALESLEGGNPPLKDNDEVAFLMMSAGG